MSLPVMFWIYGGGFKVGTGDFSFTDPTPLLEEGVIVVTFNYRLGKFHQPQRFLFLHFFPNLNRNFWFFIH